MYGDRTAIETDARLVGPLREAFDKYLFGEQVKLIPQVGALHRLTLHGPSPIHRMRFVNVRRAAGLQPLDQEQNVELLPEEESR